MSVSDVSDVSTRIHELLTVITSRKYNRFSRDQLIGAVKFLKVKLNQMKDFMQERRSRRQDEDEYEDKMLLTPYLKELGKLASKAEDLIRSSSKGTGASRSNDVLNEISFEEVIIELNNRGRLFIGPSSASFPNDQGPLKYLIRPHPDQFLVEDNYVVGFDDDLEKLVSVLVNDDSSSKSYRVVVSIWGKGGSGKTALAKKLYHDCRVRNHFDLFAWTHISQGCQRRNVWERILIALNMFDEKEDRNKLPDQNVAEKLFKFLKDSKCLLILDNIRSMEDWNSIKAALPRSEDTNSKILITCRNEEIAETVGPNEVAYLHPLKPLNGEKSLELFQKIASPRLQQLQGNRIGEQEVEEMVLECEGLPLAISVLGGICATLRDEHNSCWLIENWKNRGHGVLDVLTLSYDSMPPPLKSCFLYMSLFPDGYKISVVKLIQLWIAEYFIPFQSLMHKDNGGRKIWIEDVAECYLMELVERCIVQVGERDASSKIKTCYMNDMIRELCVLKAQELCFARIIDTTSEVDFNHLPVDQRLAAHVYDDINQIVSSHKIESLFFFNVIFSDEFIYESLPQPSEIYSTNDVSWLSALLLLHRVINKFKWFWRCLTKDFENLRVLGFEGPEIYVGGELNGDIGKLIHLRYLNLQSASYVSKLPSSLGDLIKLQTLNLGIDGKFVVYVPDVIWKLESLRHLYLPNACDDKTKLRLHTLRVLQTLVNLNTKHCYEGDLYKMTNLRELKISGHFILQNVGEVSDFNNPCWRINVTNYEHLRSLSISSPDPIDPEHLIALLSNCVKICELILTSKMKDDMLPALANHQFSSNLTCMYLCNSNLRTDPMLVLEKLPKLKVLELQKAFTTKEIVCSSKGFPQLKTLKLIDNSDLEEWKVSILKAMTKLCNLEIVNCRSLKMLPHELSVIKTLKVLKIEKMPKPFKDRLMEGEDFKHIPTIIFQNCNSSHA